MILQSIPKLLLFGNVSLERVLLGGLTQILLADRLVELQQREERNRPKA